MAIRNKNQKQKVDSGPLGIHQFKMGKKRICFSKFSQFK